MGIEMNHAHGLIPAHCAHYRQRDQVISTRRERQNSLVYNRCIKLFDTSKRILYINRVYRGVAKIGTVTKVKRFDPCCVVHVARHGRQVANLSWAVSRTGTIGSTPVPGDADQADIDLVGLLRCNIR